MGERFWEEGHTPSFSLSKVAPGMISGILMGRGVAILGTYEV